MVKTKEELENQLGEEETARARHDANFELLKEKYKLI